MQKVTLFISGVKSTELKTNVEKKIKSFVFDEKSILEVENEILRTENSELKQENIKYLDQLDYKTKMLNKSQEEIDNLCNSTFFFFCFEKQLKKNLNSNLILFL